LPDLRVNLHGVLIFDGIFTQEIKLDMLGWDHLHILTLNACKGGMLALGK
jgi:hypothetical protein